MKITFLGTGAGAPTKQRSVSGIVLQMDQRSDIWLFDCGEGTQRQILLSQVKMSHLSRIFITHLHGDHVFGIPGLLASRSLSAGSDTPVKLLGPRRLERYVRTALEISHTQLAYPLEFDIAAEEQTWVDGDYTIACAPLRHRGETWAFSISERTRPGTFDADKAAALGIPPGPLYGQLKAGGTVMLPDGTAICGADLVGPPKPGRKVVIAGDTAAAPGLAEFARGADVLVHEATYSDSDALLAERAMHSTSTGAARTALEAGVRTLILTHFSPRYEAEQRTGETSLLAEAQSIFPNTLAARDFWSYEIPRREFGNGETDEIPSV